LYINGLPKAVQENKVVLFVDDTNILLIEKYLASLKRKIFETVRKLVLTSNLVINMEKTKAILLQGRDSRLIHRPVLYLNNKEITYLSNLKFLGIYITKPRLGHSYTVPLSKYKQINPYTTQYVYLY
jgi:hypothetical protein